MRHFAAAEAQGDLHLVALLEELQHIAHLDVVVVGVGPGAELHLFDFDDLLLLAGFGFALLLFVLELAEVHDLADGRSCVGRDFDKVEARILGEALRLIGGHNSVLFTLLVNQTYFGDADAMIQTVVLSGHSAPCVMGSGIVLG